MTVETIVYAWLAGLTLLAVTVGMVIGGVLCA